MWKASWLPKQNFYDVLLNGCGNSILPPLFLNHERPHYPVAAGVAVVAEADGDFSLREIPNRAACDQAARSRKRRSRRRFITSRKPPRLRSPASETWNLVPEPIRLFSSKETEWQTADSGIHRRWPHGQATCRGGLLRPVGKVVVYDADPRAPCSRRRPLARARRAFAPAEVATQAEICPGQPADARYRQEQSRFHPMAW